MMLINIAVSGEFCLFEGVFCFGFITTSTLLVSLNFGASSGSEHEASKALKNITNTERVRTLLTIE